MAANLNLPDRSGDGGVADRVGAEWRRRPWWMNLIWLFCLYMTFIYLPFDLFIKPVAVDQEVWFGFMLTGWAAKLTAPLHWAIYAAGAYGFWKMRSWMWPWAALYVAQVSVGMGVWSLLDPRGGLWTGVVSTAVMAVPAIALWRSKGRFAR
ncbi:MAG: hypothetical protein OXP09_08145 [Gammaproteobacteria bacterium]|nr:hypothetical protein [Gammaproteobacteria bacterium]